MTTKTATPCCYQPCFADLLLDNSCLCIASESNAAKISFVSVSTELHQTTMTKFIFRKCQHLKKSPDGMQRHEHGINTVKIFKQTPVNI